jgi:hypothetical protein
MFERNDINDTRIANTYGFNDSEIPEPIETWSLEDFEDIVSGHSV